MAELLVDIVGDASKLKGALDKADDHVSSFSQKAGKIGAGMTAGALVVGAAVAKIVTGTAAVEDKYHKMSLRTGVSTENLSAWAYVADLSGTSIETLERGVKGLVTSMDDMSKGIGIGKEAYEKLGVSVVDADGNLRGIDDVLYDVADGIAAMENPTEQMAAAMDIFGAKAGPELLPFLKEGGEGIKAYMEQAEDLNMVVSTESAEAGAKFTDEMTRVTGSLAGVGREIGDVLIPALLPLVEKVTEIIGKVSEWMKQNPELVETIANVGLKIVAFAGAGGALLMLISVFGKITALLTMPAGLFVAAIMGVILIWKNWDKIVAFVQTWVEKIGTFLTNLKDSAMLKIQEMIDSVITTFEVLKELPKMLLQWGKDIISSFADGIKAAYNKVKEALGGILDWVKGVTKPGSPPKEGPLSEGGGMYQWGYDSIEDYALGYEAAAPLVYTAVEDIATKTLSLFDTLLTDFTTNFVKPFINKFVDELTPAVENFFFGIEGYKSDWGSFWSGLWDTFKTYISNMIAKLIIAVPLMLLWNALTGGVAATLWEVWNWLGFKGGGEVKGYDFGGGVDTVPAMLTPGEYVIAKPMTDFIRQFKAIPGNLIAAIAGGFPTPTPAFAGGGLLGDPGSGVSSFGVVFEKGSIDIHDNKISGDVDIKNLATKVSDEIVRKLDGRKRH